MSHTVVYRKDYTPPAFGIEEISLVVDLYPTDTLITSTLVVYRQSDIAQDVPLFLNGEVLECIAVALDHVVLEADAYEVREDGLLLHHVPDRFTLTIVNRIHPEANKALEGLYLSNNTFCTQCEPHGFRRITYYLDRPDVMARFKVKLIADKAAFPILLSNGNLIEAGDVPEGRHFVCWEDPFKKPCYLFALVAGKLDVLQDHFTTQSGRNILLEIYVEPGQKEKAHHAMASLKNSMRWDETAYGREYDLDRYMIVAVSYFNMGAMENKGLNIFNASYIFADAKTETDRDYEHVEAVVGHEYFHNWTGNRITCRDWFQLSLKEGLTVFREQQFSQSMGEAVRKRIEDIRALRTIQFREDAGPLAHPVRPDHYQEMNNFYTSTVYDKGAEVIRMLHTLLGPEGFRKGIDRYFETFDGQAVTCDDYVQVLAQANQKDFTQFMRWYAQAGTPEVIVIPEYDATEKTYSLTFEQHIPPTADGSPKLPMVIPVAMGLLDAKGKDMPLHRQGSTDIVHPASMVIVLTEARETIIFEHVLEKPVPSLFRGFSAPIKLNIQLTQAERLLALAQDSDPVNRWDAGYQLLVEEIFRLSDAFEKQPTQDHPVNAALIDAIHSVLTDEQASLDLKAQLLDLPTYSYLTERLGQVDVEALVFARNHLRTTLAETLAPVLWNLIETHTVSVPYAYTVEQVEARALCHVCLSYLSYIKSPESLKHCAVTFEQTDNMTDRLAALHGLTHHVGPDRDKALLDFYNRFEHEPLVINKWFSLQAMTELPTALSDVKKLMKHPAFDITNPNRARALISVFAHNNFKHFHAADGSGYQFLAEQVLKIDTFNPLLAARLVEPLTHFRKLKAPRSGLMREAIEHIAQASKLSSDTSEIVRKGLAS